MNKYVTEKEAFIKSAQSNNCDCIKDEIIGAAWDGDTDEVYYTQLTDALNIWQDAKNYYEGLAVGQAVPSAQMVERLTSPDWIASWWHIDDVKECVDYDLTDDQAREVLHQADMSYDSNQGINWEVLQTIADRVKEMK